MKVFVSTQRKIIASANCFNFHMYIIEIMSMQRIWSIKHKVM